MEFTKEELNLIIYVLNNQYHTLMSRLSNESLGDIERKIYERQKVDVFNLIKKLDT